VGGGILSLFKNQWEWNGLPKLYGGIPHPWVI